MKDWMIVTCEHGGNRVPRRYERMFSGWERRLATHRGFDFGALRMAGEIAAHFRAPLVASTVTRLLVDLNRSVGHRHMHSPPSRRASREERERMVRDHYLPYRTRVEDLVATAVERGQRAIHVSSHSFTPRLHGEVRRADVGLLYDPARPGERRLGALWKGAFERGAPQIRVRRNYPYAGKQDGLTSHLRRRHPPESYVGVELEINQAIVVGPAARWTRLRATVVESLGSVMASRQWRDAVLDDDSGPNRVREKE
jgi:predicted N-formylglutamate amidohydrolase